MTWNEIAEKIAYRFGQTPEGLNGTVASARSDEPPALWSALAGRGSIRAFTESAPTVEELRLFAALALAAPTKSDLQQRDVILVDDPDQVSALKRVVNDPWVDGAPVLVVVCGNNRRQRLLHAMRGHPFVNDHLDAFFNASVDAAIVLATFVLVAEAAGYGTCPISAIRNDAAKASEILALPEHVFPLAGLAVGRPAEPTEISPRLPLDLTVHVNRYSDLDETAGIEAYDRRRASVQPYADQRMTQDYGVDDTYTWSEDKARQYSKPERAGFGDFVRAKGFRLD